jgi:hypothetical protein
LGVIDSNSVLFHFLLPSLFAAIFSAILQGVGQSATTLTSLTTNFTTTPTTFNTTTTTYTEYIQTGRSQTIQGGYQIAGWGISVGCGIVAGVIIGVVYRLLNDSFEDSGDFFNDGFLFESSKVTASSEVNGNKNQVGVPAAESANKL